MQHRILVNFNLKKKRLFKVLWAALGLNSPLEVAVTTDLAKL